MTERKVLVTGFGPFFTHKVNASWEAVKEMETLGIRQNVELEIREIPVVYETVSRDIPALWEDMKPILCVHVGVSPYSCIKLEKYGQNVGYKNFDIEFKLPPGGYCHKDGPAKIQTVFNVEEVSMKVSEQLPDTMVQVSEDAGRYLCDFIYYTSLHHNKGPVVFVHVPPMDNPYSKSQLGVALKHIIETLLDQIHEGRINSGHETQ